MKKFSTQVMVFIGTFIVLLILCQTCANAQSAVYFDKVSGAIGYKFGAADVDTEARKRAIENGAIETPIRVLYDTKKGFGAIAVGIGADGKKVVGAVSGYTNVIQAQNRAFRNAEMKGAQRIKIYRTWYDR